MPYIFSRKLWSLLGFLLLVNMLYPQTNATTNSGSEQPKQEIPSYYPSFTQGAYADSSAFIAKGDTLFLLYGAEGALTAPERIDLLKSRLEKLNWTKTPLGRLKVVWRGQNLYVADSTQILFGVTDTDASHYKTNPSHLADSLAHVLKTHNKLYLQQSSWDKLTKQVLKTIALLLLLLIAFWWLLKAVGWGGMWLKKWIENPTNRVVRTLSFSRVELLGPSRVRQLFLYVANLVRFAVYLVLAYLFITLLLLFIPGTRPITAKLYTFVMEPLTVVVNSVTGFIPNLFFIVVIFVVFYYTMRLLKVIANEIENGKLTIPGFYPDWARQTYQIVRFLGLAFLLVVIFPYLPGSDSLAFKGVTIFLGVLFSLGSSTAINNLVAGLVITYMRPFVRGDWVKIGTTLGMVTQKTLLTTRLKTPKNEEISIPNSTIMSSQVQNYSSLNAQHNLLLYTTVSLRYQIPWRRAHELLLAAASRTPGLNKNKQHFILQKSLDDFYATYELNVFVDSPENMLAVYSDLHKSIQDCFNEAGIEIIAPHFRSYKPEDQLKVKAAEETNSQD